MSENIRKFVWYDLMTSDTKAAESFYRNVIGWEAKDSGMTDRSYTLFSVEQIPVAGLMPIPEHAQRAHPGWMGYIGVDDVDAYAARIQKAGGKIHRAPEDIPGVGRFCVVADPQGAGFMLFKGMGDAPAQVTAGTPGHIGWHELLASNGEEAFRFYSELFGWTKAEAVDMGAMGIYQIFATSGVPVGGMMTKTPQMPVPAWLYYFNVEAVDAAVERVKKAGGRIVLEPAAVPGGSWIVQAFDPQGAKFAFVGAKR
jgi:predicted enzyme related to lactoylglutathione lyase